MRQSTKTTVSELELERRLRDYRARGRAARTMPHVVYRPPYVLCPWPGCGFAITGIDFQLEFIEDTALYERLVDAWWNADGVVGRCPGCGRHVLFGMDEKRQVREADLTGLAVLPDDWHQRAYLLS